MSQWQDISTAPLNPAGKGVGPWVLLFSKYDNGVYQARWVAGEHRGEWVPRAKPNAYVFSQHQLTHWMPLPAPPASPSQMVGAE